MAVGRAVGMGFAKMEVMVGGVVNGWLGAWGWVRAVCPSLMGKKVIGNRGTEERFGVRCSAGAVVVRVADETGVVGYAA